MIDQDTRQALPAPMRKALDNFELSFVPTIMEMKLGNPSSYEGLTSHARDLTSYAKNMKSTIEDVGTVHFRAFADSTLTEGSKLTRSATYASTKIENARKTFKSLVENSEPEINRLKSVLKQALTPPNNAGEAAIDSELRAYARTLKPSEVATAIRQDKALIAAVSRAPAMLSGLTPELHDAIKKDHLANVVPDDIAKYEELISAVDTANKALSTLEDASTSLIDFETASRIESRKFVTV